MIQLVHKRWQECEGQLREHTLLACTLGLRRHVQGLQLQLMAISRVAKYNDITDITLIHCALSNVHGNKYKSYMIGTHALLSIPYLMISGFSIFIAIYQLYDVGQRSSIHLASI
jgi:hypothetical protein